MVKQSTVLGPAELSTVHVTQTHLQITAHSLRTAWKQKARIPHYNAAALPFHCLEAAKTGTRAALLTKLNDIGRISVGVAVVREHQSGSVQLQKAGPNGRSNAHRDGVRDVVVQLNGVVAQRCSEARARGVCHPHNAARCTGKTDWSHIHAIATRFTAPRP